MSYTLFIKKVLIVFIIFLISLNIFGQKELLVPQFNQLDATWCWAACQQMVYSYHLKNISQDTIVETYFKIIENNNTKNCNNSTCDKEILGCSRQIWVDTLRKLVNYYGYKTYKKTYSLNWDTLKSRINEFKPFIVSQEIGSTCKSTHLLTSKGYCQSDNSKFLLTNDPGACKNQNIIAIRFNTSPLKICSAVLDSFNTPNLEHSAIAVNNNSNTCLLSDIINPTKSVVLGQVNLLMASKKKKSILVQTNDTIDLRRSIEVEYVVIKNGKIIKVNKFPIRDILYENEGDSSGYIINRVAIVDSKAETQMILKGQFINFKELQVEPTVKIGNVSFSLDRGLYKKIILLDRYEDFIQFKYNGDMYYYPLNNCKDCHTQILTEQDFLKKTYRRNLNLLSN